MPHYRVAWLLPISQPPIRDAWLQTDRGRIIGFGHCRPGDFSEPEEIDLGDTAVLPGLVNAHTHLELSWLRGRIPETDDFPRWITSVVTLSREVDYRRPEIELSIANGVAEARKFGTVLVGDVSNTLTTTAPLLGQKMAAVIFHELIGFQSADAKRILSEAIDRIERLPQGPHVRHTIAPHAPYSVSPELFAAIRQWLLQTAAQTTVHLSESTAELEFLQRGTGPWRTLLESLGVWDPSWAAPTCAPLEYLNRMGFLAPDVLFVHGVYLNPDEMRRLSETGATLVTCPRGNRRTGAGVPPISDFFESGIRVAVGTDSLASVPDLNLFAELAEMRSLAPEIPARLLLESATINGARALGVDSELGTIEPGKSDRLVTIALERPVANIEEELVSGIDEARIRWLAS